MIEAALFKSGMRRLAAGVSIITTTFNGERHGLVATSVCSVSAEPPSLLVCVNQVASSHTAIQQAGIFCVNLLALGDDELAKRFSDPAARATRFADREWTTLATGAPALVGALASFDCEIAATVPSGSHTIFIGNVQAAELWQSEKAPLIYLDGRFVACNPHP
ncbi:flavin reductase [Pseudolabrys taiwanensis]|uniref:Flavin reductase n=1 Tax=Pseudolabrys taiwanensis TaxID=331696 RepID=A0A346A161_9HYPH|nr:flavin reductase family protein [Pseudolabrys taiwanensis]AXK82908.1 flavin reductase [Pseudolabrys taiwanensis]